MRKYRQPLFKSSNNSIPAVRETDNIICWRRSEIWSERQIGLAEVGCNLIQVLNHPITRPGEKLLRGVPIRPTEHFSQSRTVMFFPTILKTGGTNKQIKATS
jgi:hypothetical protein